MNRSRWPKLEKHTFASLRAWLYKQRPYSRYFTRGRCRMRMVAPNTWLILRRRNEITLTLYGTDVLRYTPKFIEINMSSWRHSPTTRSRVSFGLGYVIPRYSSGVWKLRGDVIYGYRIHHGLAAYVPYFTGMKVDYHGVPVDGSVRYDHLRKRNCGPARRRTQKFYGGEGLHGYVYAPIGYGYDKLAARIV